jgi:hypothetical protein
MQRWPDSIVGMNAMRKSRPGWLPTIHSSTLTTTRLWTAEVRMQPLGMIAWQGLSARFVRTCTKGYVGFANGGHRLQIIFHSSRLVCTQSYQRGRTH